jgi:hypothetical protein
MRHVVIPLALGLGACAGPQRFSGPAPANAVDCAVREAQRLGYQKMAGETEEGAVRVGLHIPKAPVTETRRMDPNKASDQPSETGPEVADTPMDAQLRFLYAGGRLTIQVISGTEKTAPPGMQQTVTSHAQQILALCTSPT